jgi:hypothetical protein
LKLIGEATEGAYAAGCTQAEAYHEFRRASKHFMPVVGDGTETRPPQWHDRQPLPPEQAILEAGDCQVVLDNIAYRAGVDLGNLRDIAMTKNRLRHANGAWRKMPNGTVQHAEGTE